MLTHMITDVNAMCFFKWPQVIEFQFVLPILPKRKRMWGVNQRLVCVCVCFVGRGFHSLGIWVLQLVMVQHQSNRQVRADEWEAAANDR